MAIEAVKAAAMTYQGSASVAASPVKVKESGRPEQAGKSDQKAAEANGNDTVSAKNETVKPLQPVSGDQEERDGSTGGNNGQQTSRQLQQAVEKLKQNMKSQTEAVFGFHEGTNRVIIKIVDKDTKDIIKEYPPEETLDMIQKVWEMAGIMVDERG